VKFTSARTSFFCATMFISSFHVGALTCVMPKIKQADACGLVMTPDGQGIPDAQVTLILTSDSIDARTDSEGRLTFPNLSGNKLKLAARVNGFMAVSDWPIEKLEESKQGKCKRPIYVVMEVGGNSCSYATAQKKDLPKAEKK